MRSSALGHSLGDGPSQAAGVRSSACAFESACQGAGSLYASGKMADCFVKFKTTDVRNYARMVN